MTKLTTMGRAHPLLAVLMGFVVLFLGGAAWAGVSMMRSFAPVQVDWSVPQAPQLTATGPDRTVYRIDATRSSASYAIEENLAGSDRTTVGTTRGIAGDILVDDADPSASQLGDVVVDVLQLTSDNSMRDNRIRHDFLQSEDYPLATYATDSIDGLPESIDDGTDYAITVHGELTLKDTTLPVDLDATVRRDGDELAITASTTLTLSDFDIGPIRVVGLASAGDVAELTFDLVAVDAATYEEPEQIAPEFPEYASGGPSFAHTVQPILEASCASCHQSGGAGAGTWTLDTAGDAAQYASGLSLVTETRYMPPWPASDVGIPLQHSMRLSDEEVAAIVDWAQAGGPLDVDPDTAITPVEPEIAPVRHDLDLPLPEAYQTTTEKPNDYRCFMLDPGFTEPTVVTGYEVEPDQVEAVHHVLVYRMHASSLDAIADTDAADPGPGWECFGGINVRGAGLPGSGAEGESDLVFGYAPGQPPTQYAEGTGMHAEPGDVFVAQMHYHTTHVYEPDRSVLHLQLADDDPAGYTDIDVATYTAPAEIPCFPEDADLPACDRANELQRLLELYGPMGPGIANGVHMLCGTTPEELAHLDEDGVAYASCDHRIGHESKLLAVLGHMHEIGLSYRMTLNPDTPGEKVLLDIPRWDFDWQFNYAPVEDITLHEGDTIRVECSWDRNLVPEGQDPHYVTWAEGTEDEMCFSTVATTRVDDP